MGMGSGGKTGERGGEGEVLKGIRRVKGREGGREKELRRQGKREDGGEVRTGMRAGERMCGEREEKRRESNEFPEKALFSPPPPRPSGERGAETRGSTGRSERPLQQDRCI